MLIAVDMGNTNINIGVYKDKTLINHWRIETNIHRTYDEFGILMLNLLKYNDISVSDIEGIILSSVVPEGMYSLQTGMIKYLKLEPITVNVDMNLGLKIKYDNPTQLGTDRICSAVAAYEIYGGPVIVIDSGTATTISGVNKGGEFLGGVILPGIFSLGDTLHNKTAKLPKVTLNRPLNVISTNTVDAINSGIIYGYAGMVDRIVYKMIKEMNEESVTVVGTGGLIQIYSDETDTINEIYDFLTLEGLRILYEKNK